MWADSLLAFERGHLLRLAVWAGLSVLAGALLLWWVFARRLAAPFIKHFALQMLAWGLVDSAITLWSWSGLELRDYASATKLQQFLWLNVGLDLGYAAVGATLAVTGWVLGKRLGAVGAGIGIILQGLVLFVLDVRLLTIISPTQ